MEYSLPGLKGAFLTKKTTKGNKPAETKKPVADSAAPNAAEKVDPIFAKAEQCGAKVIDGRGLSKEEFEFLLKVAATHSKPGSKIMLDDKGSHLFLPPESQTSADADDVEQMGSESTSKI